MSNSKPWLGKRSITPSALANVLRDVQEATGVPPHEVMGRARFREIARARQLVMWKLRQTGVHSFPEIGRVLGLDHTTVIAGVRSHEARMGGEGAE